MQAAPRQMAAVGLGKGFPAPHSAMHPLMEGCRVLRPHRGSGCCVPPFGPPVLHGGTISQGPCPSWCLCAEFPLDFLPHLARVRSLRRAGLSCLSWLQAALGIQCSAMPLLPSHPALLSAFSCPPCCVLGPGFISGVEMGPGKSERSVWAAGPCLWCPFLAGAAQGAAQGLSCHSQQGSFFFGNTQQSPVHPTGSGLPVHRPHGAETQHWLCKSDTFIFFFKSPLPNCSILWRG